MPGPRGRHGWRGGRGPAALRYRYGTRYHHHPDGRVTA